MDAALFDRTGADLPAIPCDFADQAACDAHTECQWLGASCEPVATSLCGALDWAQCNTSAGCHWFYRDGTGLMPDDPDCTCDPFDLDCSCVLSCDVHAHWNTAGDVCLDSAEQPVAGLCCAVMTSYCVEDRPCPEYETPKRCGNDLRCIFIPSNDQYLPGHCDYRPDAG
ncbi:MAG: hypothetical protein JXR83_20010 [Deltaproteobacteria bacterium]|nr:hypothetical protein [Deltaproteobacteria bacterium]